MHHGKQSVLLASSDVSAIQPNQPIDWHNTPLGRIAAGMYESFSVALDTYRPQESQTFATIVRKIESHPCCRNCQKSRSLNDGQARYGHLENSPISSNTHALCILHVKHFFYVLSCIPTCATCCDGWRNSTRRVDNVTQLLLFPVHQHVN
ncbi:hypothetical protein LZ31DRAFT_103954 [Colletotrichum somersetense]|nr:hypothetical protein LZ31DRAFT_103954 [Colletotrichum somersetense]